MMANPVKFIPKTVTTNSKEVNTMDKAKLILAFVSNSANKYTVNDIDQLTAMSESELNKIIATNSLDEETAKTFLATNSKIDFAAVEEFAANKAEFEQFKADKAATQKAVIDNIVANSEYTEELLTGKSDAELTLITNMLEPKKAAVQIGNQAKITTNSANDAELDFS